MAEHLTREDLRMAAGLTDEPASWPSRTTASGLLVVKGTVLLERRSATARVTAGVWDTPGGHLIDGERPEVALLRELKEELGVVPSQFSLAAVQDDVDATASVLYRHFVYLVTAWRGEVAATEGQTLAWLPVQDALELPDLNPRTARLLEDLLRRGLL